MNLIVKGLHVGLTKAIADYIEKRLLPKVERQFPEATVEIVLDDDARHIYKVCKLRVFGPHVGQPIHLSEEDRDLYTAVDRSCDRLKRLLKRQEGLWEA